MSTVEAEAVVSSSPAAEAAVLSLSADEAVAVAEAAAAFAAALPAGRDAPYRALVSAAQVGAVPAEQADVLERVCALALQTGKARQIGRAESERLLSAVLARTPGGRAMAEDLAEVNRALSQFAGRRLESARLTSRLPGHYDLSLTVDGFALTMAIGPEGVHFRSLNVG